VLLSVDSGVLRIGIRSTPDLGVEHKQRCVRVEHYVPVANCIATLRAAHRTAATDVVE